MASNMVDALPRVNPAGPKILRADGATGPDDAPKQSPFVRMTFDVLANQDLSDAAKVALGAIQKWTWNGGQPTNTKLAIACGWITKGGEPAVTKAKTALRELEAAGLIKRTVANREGWHVRESIAVNLPSDPAAPKGGRDSAHPQTRFRPSGGRDSTRGGGRDSAPSVDRCRRNDEDSLRSAEGDLIPSTTTTKAKNSDPKQLLGKSFNLAEIGKLPAKPSVPKPVPTEPAAEFSLAEPPKSAEAPMTKEERLAALVALQGMSTGPNEPAAPPEPPTALAAGPDLNAGQRGVLAKLDADGLRAAFDALDETTRRGFLAHFHDCSILDADGILDVVSFNGFEGVSYKLIVKRLIPREPMPPPVTPASSMPAILEALGRREWMAPETFASRLAHEFEDRKSINFYTKTAQEVLTGKRTVECIQDALREATGEKAKSPGKIFTHAVKRWDKEHRIAV